MTRSFKRLISALLVIAMLLTSVGPVFAEDGETLQQEEQVLEQVEEVLEEKEEEPAEEVEETISEEEETTTPEEEVEEETDEETTPEIDVEEELPEEPIEEEIEEEVPMMLGAVPALGATAPSTTLVVEDGLLTKKYSEILSMLRNDDIASEALKNYSDDQLYIKILGFPVALNSDNQNLFVKDVSYEVAYKKNTVNYPALLTFKLTTKFKTEIVIKDASNGYGTDASPVLITENIAGGTADYYKNYVKEVFKLIYFDDDDNTHDLDKTISVSGSISVNSYNSQSVDLSYSGLGDNDYAGCKKTVYFQIVDPRFSTAIKLTDGSATPSTITVTEAVDKTLEAYKAEILNQIAVWDTKNNIKVTDAEISLSGFKVSDIAKSQTVKASFDKTDSYQASEVSFTVVTTLLDRYTVNVSYSSNGSATINGESVSSATVVRATDVTVSFTPSKGYYLKSVTVNNEDVTVNNEDAKFSVSNNVLTIAKNTIDPDATATVAAVFEKASITAHNGIITDDWEDEYDFVKKVYDAVYDNAAPQGFARSNASTSYPGDLASALAEEGKLYVTIQQTVLGVSGYYKPTFATFFTNRDLGTATVRLSYKYDGQYVHSEPVTLTVTKAPRVTYNITTNGYGSVKHNLLKVEQLETLPREAASFTFDPDDGYYLASVTVQKNSETATEYPVSTPLSFAANTFSGHDVVSISAEFKKATLTLNSTCNVPADWINSLTQEGLAKAIFTAAYVSSEPKTFTRDDVDLVYIARVTDGIVVEIKNPTGIGNEFIPVTYNGLLNLFTYEHINESIEVQLLYDWNGTAISRRSTVTIIDGRQEPTITLKTNPTIDYYDGMATLDPSNDTITKAGLLDKVVDVYNSTPTTLSTKNVNLYYKPSALEGYVKVTDSVALSTLFANGKAVTIKVDFIGDTEYKESSQTVTLSATDPRKASSLAVKDGTINYYFKPNSSTEHNITTVSKKDLFDAVFNGLTIDSSVVTVNSATDLDKFNVYYKSSDLAIKSWAKVTDNINVTVLTGILDLGNTCVIKLEYVGNKDDKPCESLSPAKLTLTDLRTVTRTKATSEIAFDYFVGDAGSKTKLTSVSKTDIFNKALPSLVILNGNSEGATYATWDPTDARFKDGSGNAVEGLSIDDFHVYHFLTEVTDSNPISVSSSNDEFNVTILFAGTDTHRNETPTATAGVKITFTDRIATAIITKDNPFISYYVGMEKTTVTKAEVFDAVVKYIIETTGNTPLGLTVDNVVIKYSKDQSLIDIDMDTEPLLITTFGEDGTVNIKVSFEGNDDYKGCETANPITLTLLDERDPSKFTPKEIRELNYNDYTAANVTEDMVLDAVLAESTPEFTLGASGNSEIKYFICSASLYSELSQYDWAWASINADVDTLKNSVIAQATAYVTGDLGLHNFVDLSKDTEGHYSKESTERIRVHFKSGNPDYKPGTWYTDVTLKITPTITVENVEVEYNALPHPMTNAAVKFNETDLPVLAALVNYTYYDADPAVNVNAKVVSDVLGPTNVLRNAEGKVIPYYVTATTPALGNFTAGKLAQAAQLKINPATPTVEIYDLEAAYSGATPNNPVLIKMFGIPDLIPALYPQYSYTYYEDADCTVQIDAPTEPGIYYVKATTNETNNFYSATTKTAAKLTIMPKVSVVDTFGNTKLAGSTIDVFSAEDVNGNYTITNQMLSKWELKDGYYNLVSEFGYKTEVKILHIVNGEIAPSTEKAVHKNVHLAVSSTVPTVVNGLGKAANKLITEDEVNNNKVDLKLTVTRLDTPAENLQKKFSVSGYNVQSKYYEMDVTKTLTSLADSKTTTENISDTKAVLEIIIPLELNLPAGNALTVERIHGTGVGEKRDSFKQINDRTGAVDGTFMIDGDNLIIFASQFSTYRVSYVNTYVPSPSVKTYKVVLPDAVANGTIKADKKNASKNSTVILTAKAAEDFRLGSLTVVDKNGASVELTNLGDGKYSFKMPASDVTVKVSFVNGCDRGEGCSLRAFPDLNPLAWYHDGIEYCLDEKIMNGFSNGLFAPQQSLTRSMLVSILWRMAGKPVVNYAMNFSDVNGLEWYAEAVRWAASEKIVSGYPDGRFGPKDNITREQFAAILYRFGESQGVDFSKYTKDTNTLSFEDIFTVRNFAKTAMNACIASGIISGSKGYVKPQGLATRAEAATMMYRFCGVFEEK